MGDSHKHHSDHHDDSNHAASPIKNKFMENLLKITNIFDGPATFFHGKSISMIFIWSVWVFSKPLFIKKEKIIKNTRKDYPYYHRQYKRVPTVDECSYGDQVCIYEANEQFMRDR